VPRVGSEAPPALSRDSGVLPCTDTPLTVTLLAWVRAEDRERSVSAPELAPDVRRA
jgi:hypothetical protein